MILRLCGFPEAFLPSSPQGSSKKKPGLRDSELPREVPTGGGGEVVRAPVQAGRLVSDNFGFGDSGHGRDPNKVSGDYLDI